MQIETNVVGGCTRVIVVGGSDGTDDGEGLDVGIWVSEQGKAKIYQVPSAPRLLYLATNCHATGYMNVGLFDDTSYILLTCTNFSTASVSTSHIYFTWKE